MLQIENHKKRNEKSRVWMWNG